MKTEQLIVKYLYTHKKVTLQEIGVFSIASEIEIPEDSDKDIALPADTIKFVYDPKAPVDDGLVAFIMESTRKIKPLAYSDLESFIILNTQFLNIGKPMVFEGLGTLQKTQQGHYTFTQANTSHVINEELPKLITEKLKEKVTFATPQKERKTNNNKIALLILLGVVILGAALAGVYFINKNKKEGSLVNASTNNVIDTLPSIKKDTAITNTSTLPAVNIVKDSNNFYIVINEYTDLDKAEKRLKKLSGYGNNLVLTTKDSVTYKLRMPFRKPLMDTVAVKDSLAKFFSVNTYVEMP